MKNDDYNAILIRLSNITVRLSKSESLSVKELAGEYSVSERTIQRDFNIRLKNLFPLEQIKKRWKLKEGYIMKKDIALEEEIAQYLVTNIFESIGGRFSKIANTLIEKKQKNNIYQLDHNEKSKMNKKDELAILRMKILFKKQSVLVVKNVDKCICVFCIFYKSKFCIIHGNGERKKFDTVEEVFNDGWKIAGSVKNPV